MRFRYLALWVVAVLATGAAFVSYLALRFETVRLGYELDKASREHEQLLGKKRLIMLEAESLRERQRVRAIAERSLGMTTPDLGRTVVVDGRNEAQGQPATGGRAR